MFVSHNHWYRYNLRNIYFIQMKLYIHYNLLHTQDSKYKTSMPWWLALNVSHYIFPCQCSGSSVVYTPFLDSRFTEGVVCRIYKFGLVVALDNTFLKLGHLNFFLSRICFMTSFRWSSPLSRVVILLAVRDLLLSTGILEKVFCRGMGDTKYFDILDVIFSNESNDVRFVRVIIWAYRAGLYVKWFILSQHIRCGFFLAHCGTESELTQHKEHTLEL